VKPLASPSRGKRPRAVFVTTEDRFFLSHRLPVAQTLTGFSVTVAAADTGCSEQIRALGYDFTPIPLVRDSLSPATEAKTLAALISVYARLTPDVVHHSTIKANMYGSFAARLMRVPAIVNTVTGLGYALTERPEDALPQRLLRFAARKGYGTALRSPRCVNVFQNHAQLDNFVSHGLVERAQAVVILGAGVDMERFVPTPLPVGRPLVVLPARMLWDKGIGEFVEAARRLKGSARFALVGGEDPRNRAAIPRTQLEAWGDVIEWWGFRQDMPRVFSEATLVVLPSYAEGLPLAIAEAQACGRACITTDAPGCREAIVPNVSGLLVPLRDSAALASAISALLGDRGRLEAMGVAGHAYAREHLARDRVMTQTMDVFRRLRVL
jgi:glycosyltransferase involved in cell wall biosynthesis